eukprot:685721-Pleurochrysis_carterae.AAC.4
MASAHSALPTPKQRSTIRIKLLLKFEHTLYLATLPTDFSNAGIWRRVHSDSLCCTISYKNTAQRNLAALPRVQASPRDDITSNSTQGCQSLLHEKPEELLSGKLTPLPSKNASSTPELCARAHQRLSSSHIDPILKRVLLYIQQPSPPHYMLVKVCDRRILHLTNKC